MGMSVNTNANAMAALRTLNSTQRSLSETQGRIESGFRVGNARHDASSFAIAQGMRSDVSGMRAVKDTLNVGISTVEVASAAAKRISDALIDLQGQVAKGQAENLDQAIIQRDVDERLALIQGYADSAQFNGVNLLSSNATLGSLNVLTGLTRTDAATMTPSFLTVQTSQKADLEGLSLTGLQLDASSFKIDTDQGLDILGGTNLTVTYTGMWDDDDDATTPDVARDQTAVFELVNSSGAPTAAASDTQKVFAVVIDTATDSQLTRLGKLMDVVAQSGLGFNVNLDNEGTLTINGGNITNVTTDVAGATVRPASADGALNAIDNAQGTMKTIMAELGSAANRLQAQADFTQELMDNLDVGIGTLVDADLAAESARLNALQTREQLGIQSLSIANQASQTVLSLFR